ncbi:MAG: hypothetical protein VYA92_06710 [Actinomycetota bacterium]|nr:hypothetical protein [Actinomycetota bacterium]MEC8815484.1 hypothetical protein [Actinomycetota bacterium]MEC8873609.1 hypothetical protein [Actinomycetota bacterium]MEC8969782.1 hypothetical protein [Actinomycetota bacterium]MEC9057429.1 hypothetical protein [Actinomycetota bacterium]
MTPPRTILGATVSAALLVSACGGGGAGSGITSMAEDGVLRVVGLDTQDFDADGYRVDAGEVTVEYQLSGFQNHTLVVEGREDELRLEVENGGTDSGTIILEPGRYILYCDVAGHREGGMEARLLVE